jgi:hypothetical protein
VLTGTNVLEPKVSGNRSSISTPCTEPGVRASIPMNTEVQLRQIAKPIARRHAAATSSTPVLARKPIA